MNATPQPQDHDLLAALGGMESATLDQLRDAERGGEGIRLPFPAMYAYVLNGDAKLKQLGNVQYFGGFATDADKVGEMVEAGELPDFPEAWSAFEGQGEKGAYHSLGARSLRFAPIGYRQSWIGSDSAIRGEKYDPDKGLTRRHIQYLGQMLDDASHVFPVVITAKGYQAQNLIEALGRWKTALGPHLKALNATRFPLSAFWLHIGTTGPKPEFVTVGKKTTHAITPIRPLIPEGLGLEAVAALFVGRENLMLHGELLSQSAEWRGAWKALDGANADIVQGEPVYKDLPA